MGVGDPANDGMVVTAAAAAPGDLVLARPPINGPLGYVTHAVLASNSGSITTEADVLTVQFTAVPNRRYKVTFYIGSVFQGTAGQIRPKITDGANAQLATALKVNAATANGNEEFNLQSKPLMFPGGLTTIKGRISANNAIIVDAANGDCFLLVEDIDAGTQPQLNSSVAGGMAIGSLGSVPSRQTNLGALLTTASYQNYGASVPFVKKSSTSVLRVTGNWSSYATAGTTAAAYGFLINGLDRDAGVIAYAAASTRYPGGLNTGDIAGLPAGTYTIQPRIKAQVGTPTVTMDTNDWLLFEVEEVETGAFLYGLAAGVPLGTLPGGYAQSVAAQSAIAAEADLTNLLCTVTTLAGRRIRASATVNLYKYDAVAGQVVVWLYIDGVKTRRMGQFNLVANGVCTITGSYVHTPAAGQHVYKLRCASVSAGSVQTTPDNSTDQGPDFLLIEDIGV